MRRRNGWQTITDCSFSVITMSLSSIHFVKASDSDITYVVRSFPPGILRAQAPARFSALNCFVPSESNKPNRFTFSGPYNSDTMNSRHALRSSRPDWPVNRIKASFRVPFDRSISGLSGVGNCRFERNGFSQDWLILDSIGRK